ncbi:MAG TPA: DUF4397 domain-containing protein [Candidatus Cybelea sp.]|nr:DUF4397 domain-containing protein [Candidatus Cybelea sp.]
MTLRTAAAVLTAMLATAGCGGSSSSSSAMPPGSSNMVRARFGDGAPELEAIINGVPQSIGQAYLQVDGQTVDTQFSYGSMTQFLFLTPGTHSLTALDDLGYRVGPLKSASLSTGKEYTLILVGSYPKYRVLAFEEPASIKGGAQLSLYEASPQVPKASFGRFTASGHSNFKQLGSAAFGNVATVALGSGVSDFGGYVGKGNQAFPGDALTLRQVSAFDKQNELPFHNATRLSLFFYDKVQGSSGSVFGSLDK